MTSDDFKHPRTGETLVLIGRFGRPHGVRGQMRFTPLADDPSWYERLIQGAEGKPIEFLRVSKGRVWPEPLDVEFPFLQLGRDLPRSDESDLSDPSDTSDQADGSDEADSEPIYSQAPLFVKIRGIESPEEAKKYSGDAIAIAESARPAPEPGDFYADELPGLRVFGPQGDEVGRVIRLVESAAGDMLEIEPRGVSAFEMDEVLLPLDKNLIDRIDVARGEVRLKIDLRPH